jgi:6-phosphogluconolactonase
VSDVQVYPDATTLTHAAAEHFVARAAEAVTARGRFTVALSGGSTPRSTYTLLASADNADRSGRQHPREFAPRVDWPRVHVFWGDERCVPPDHPDSNYRTAHEALLRHVPIPAGNVHRIHGELDPAQAAREYERALLTVFGASPGGSPPRFDLVLLGMGSDGHTASLFPGTAAIHERERWVVAHYVPKLSAWRVTLTPAVINAAAQVTFLVAGAGKAKRLRQVLVGPHQPDILPAQIVSPTGGRALWLADAAAASRL